MINRPLYMNKINKWVDRPVIKVITGIRRCGKSSLIKLTIDSLLKRSVQEEALLYYNLELFENRVFTNAESLYHAIKNNTINYERTYIFIDEIQKCHGWQEVVASLLAEGHYDIYITGSNASMLSGDLATHIAGRYIEIKVHPLSFIEFKTFHETVREQGGDINSLFNEYLRYGGFPGIFSIYNDDESKRQYLQSIRDTVVLRDSVQRHDIRDVDLLEQVMAYAFDNIGQIFSATTVVNYLKNIGFSPTVPTVTAYLNALSDAMIIEHVPRYDIKGKKVMQRMEKYFIADLGIRHSEIGYRDNDIAQLLENVVYNHLLINGYEVYVGKEGEREVDFIAIKGDDRIYIQVTYLLVTEKVIEREYKSLLAIKDAYPKLVLSMDRVYIGPKQGVKHKYLLDFLMESPNE